MYKFIVKLRVKHFLNSENDAFIITEALSEKLTFLTSREDFFFINKILQCLFKSLFSNKVTLIYSLHDWFASETSTF